jgi:hypothetical protein
MAMATQRQCKRIDRVTQAQITDFAILAIQMVFPHF